MNQFSNRGQPKIMNMDLWARTKSRAERVSRTRFLKQLFSRSLLFASRKRLARAFVKHFRMDRATRCEGSNK